MHLGLFLLLAGTARLRFGRAPAVLAAVLAYAAVSEVVQAQLLRTRSGDLWDVAADAVGALAGWWLAAAAAGGGKDRRLSRRPPPTR